tara:strand:- start:5446 stop:6012 length:567 start_codon:yes stop_codon:yes gene_type:complete
MGKQFRRAHLRAPLHSTLLYEDDGYVLKARTLNISEGGVLLENLPRIPEINAMPLVLNLMLLPELSKERMDQLLAKSSSQYERLIIRVKARMVRSFEVKEEVDQIFITRIGCEFVKPTAEALAAIKDYVARFAKNTIYLLSLFEGHGNRPEQIYFLRHISGLLGYDSSLPLPRLRQKVLHDYQSLESL